MAENQLVHVKAQVAISCGLGKLQSSLRCLANGETKITQLKELVPKDKPSNRLILYKEILDSASSGSEDS